MGSSICGEFKKNLINNNVYLLIVDLFLKIVLELEDLNMHDYKICRMNKWFGEMLNQ